MTADDTIQMVPVNAITVLNPRVRNKRIFQELVTSISHLGLKKPITVSRRPDGRRFDLVCGQGRLEAFMALDQTEIPAIIVDVSEEDCFIMSLVENLARRQHTPIELMRTVGVLRDRGHSVAEVAKKVDMSTAYIHAICGLLERGEEKLLSAVDRGVIPPSIAMQIAEAKDGDVQRALASAYEEKTIPGNQVLAIRKIIEQRSSSGKTIHSLINPRTKKTKPVTSDSLIRAYEKETERQRQMVKRANLAQGRLLFIVNALRRLLADEHFGALMRAEGVTSVPRPLLDRVRGGATVL